MLMTARSSCTIGKMPWCIKIHERLGKWNLLIFCWGLFSGGSSCLSVCLYVDEKTLIHAFFFSHLQSYSLPYKANGACRDNETEYLFGNHCCSKCRPGKMARRCVTWWSSWKCWNVLMITMCHDTGTRKARDCTGENDTACESCPAEMYSDNMNYYPNCFSCSKCPEGRSPFVMILICSH